MPRQNFLTRESFVEATENQAKESLLSVPVFASNIRFIAENTRLQSFRFYYLVSEKSIEYPVDVTILPLNTQYTRICLHSEHSNGKAFDNDSDMAVALRDFESAIHAALKDDVSLYKPNVPKEKKSKNILQLATTLAASAGIFFLRKKLS
jgi:hypothetical protein